MLHESQTSYYNSLSEVGAVPSERPRALIGQQDVGLLFEQQDNRVLVRGEHHLNVLRRRGNARHAARLLDQFVGFRFSSTACIG